MSAAAPTTARTTPTMADARWLASVLGGVTVIDTRRSSEYLDGHVPGACSFPLDMLLVEDTSREALERLARDAQAALAARGITPEDHVVLVDDADGSAALGAAIIELAGVTRVTVVHGGVREWTRLGHPLDMLPPAIDAVRESAFADVDPDLSGVASFEDLVAASTGSGTLLIDARAQLEHEGIVGAPCCGCRGAIPGSAHLEWTAFIDMAGEPHRPDRVHQLADHLGLDELGEVVLYCHAGHRAAVAARVLRSAGYRRVRLSLGSWHEWSGRAMPTASDTED